MANERCPSCGGAVRAGDPWCTLCWTDLRPKPAPPPAPVASARPAPVTAPVAPVAPVAVPAQGGAQGGVDPLTAPLAVLLGEPLAADPGAPSAATWPCVECGEPNALDRETCGVCTAPFGGRISRLGDVKAARRRFMVISLGAMVAFLAVLAILTFAFTDSTPGGGDVPLEPTIDYSSLPRE
jgi:hypothetical protein